MGSNLAAFTLAASQFGELADHGKVRQVPRAQTLNSSQAQGLSMHADRCPCMQKDEGDAFME